MLHRDDLWRHSDRFVSLSEHDASKFKQHTDATLFKACDHLRQGDEIHFENLCSQVRLFVSDYVFVEIEIVF